jgi:hypothetical protein
VEFFLFLVIAASYGAVFFIGYAVGFWVGGKNK